MQTTKTTTYCVLYWSTKFNAFMPWAENITKINEAQDAYNSASEHIQCVKLIQTTTETKTLKQTRPHP